MLVTTATYGAASPHPCCGGCLQASRLASSATPAVLCPVNLSRRLGASLRCRSIQQKPQRKRAGVRCRDFASTGLFTTATGPTRFPVLIGASLSACCGRVHDIGGSTAAAVLVAAENTESTRRGRTACGHRRQRASSTGQHAASAGLLESPAASAARPLGRRVRGRFLGAVDVVRGADRCQQGRSAAGRPVSGARALHGSLRTLRDGTDVPLQRVPGRRHRHFVGNLPRLPLYRAFDRQLAVHVRTPVRRRGTCSQCNLPQYDDRSLAQVRPQRHDVIAKR